MISYFLIGFIVLISNQNINCLLSCRNEDGTEVDWFYLWSPEKQMHTNSIIARGDGYVYIDSNSNSPEFKLSEKSIGSESSYIGSTFLDVYKNNKKYSYLQYSDEKPKPVNPVKVSNSKLMKNLFKNLLNYVTSPKFAISKGTIVWNIDDSKFIWFSHSAKHFMPRFDTPSINGKQYSFPENGKNEGQNFLCLTLKISELNKVFDHLLVMTPQIYDNGINSNPNSNPSDLEKEIHLKIEQLTYSIKPGYNINLPIRTFTINKRKLKKLTQDLVTNKDLQIKIASKSRREIKDIYGILWPALDAKSFALKSYYSTKSNFKRIKSILNSSCKLKEKMHEILDVNIKIKNNKDKIYFGEHDNSNWGVCPNGVDCFCFSDINNSSFYKNKGGGVICLMSSVLKQAFQSTIAKPSNC